MEDAVIRVKNLKKTYITFERGHNFLEALKSLFYRKSVPVEALRGISFDIGRGEIAALLGPNGAGKSTTLKILTGILYPTSGEVNVMGYIPWKERKRYVGKIGAVFGQKSQLIFDIPPVDSFFLNQAVYNIPDGKFRKILDEMVELLNVGSVIRKPTRVLSLGERMKCEFIMAMLHSPRIVFLDEPTIGLDIIAKEKIREFITEMNRQGVTFILTTHDLDDVERLARRVIVINHGEIVFDGPLSNLRNYFGGKKTVTLNAEREWDGKGIPGVSVIQFLSPKDLELEIDISVITLRDFIQSADRTCGIRDISIRELPIERAIRELYQ
jgi:ABC-2 type transport system ATP-binding protein